MHFFHYYHYYVLKIPNDFFSSSYFDNTLCNTCFNRLINAVYTLYRMVYKKRETRDECIVRKLDSSKISGGPDAISSSWGIPSLIERAISALSERRYNQSKPRAHDVRAFDLTVIAIKRL